MTSTSIIGSILSWLSAGYPEGVPPTDRFPLLALLRRTLTEDQVKEVVAKLTDPASPAQVDGVVSQDEIEKFITDVTKDDPTAQDISRVASRLAAGGWPLAGVDSTALDA
ncbi:DUF3349 domain-containing protein [Mycobacterium sp. CBMA271]|uniref:DUF3349 domain-containing protein n=1 Tax=unclassified Mycobacteroides TaxID=2618759 RepID=UPI00132A1FE2|nr:MULTISPECIES: DUF3349 domain-containing protein [unclassified Mycobacteroides]MUM17814.1 hypothetical protein [Mycobacteroides sp. CBMA 326]MUM20385.1 DUF3349 domain-containing protein [Mycobacteroides sp. CBMA 271]